ncbi:MAG: glycerate kinase [Bacteroidota bacterium]
MKILIATDKFKGSLSAIKVCNSLAKGLNQYDKNIYFSLKPMADGGDGSLDILKHYYSLNKQELIVNDPLFRKIKSSYYISKNKAFIELSLASGLALLNENEKNCMLTSTFGTGELIADSIKKGVEEINLFIGGSSTNDGGIGIASALGFKFFDSSEKLLLPIGKNLSKIERIDDSQSMLFKKKIRMNVICDVENPLYGKNGAAYVYAKQKGANSEEIKYLNNGLINLESKLLKHNYQKISHIKGSGAAGGVGGGSMALFNAKLISGINYFLDITKLEKTIQEFDLIITGEGRLDYQTEKGKVVMGLYKLAKRYDKPVILVCGDYIKNALNKYDFKKIFTVLEKANSIYDSIKNTDQYLTMIGFEIAKYLKKI